MSTTMINLKSLFRKIVFDFEEAEHVKSDYTLTQIGNSSWHEQF